MVRAAAVALLLSGVIPTGEALGAGYFKSGNQLYADCTAPEGSSTYYVEVEECRAFILGVFDDLNLDREIRGLPDCSPQGITAAQVRDVVVAYLRNNAASRHLSAAILIRFAVIEAWPACGFAP